jgi:uncharacterized OsmC-like protein
MADAELLLTDVRSTSIGVKGRCVTSARTNHVVIDEPAFNGGPGEAMTPGEVFLSGVIGCGVLLVESFAHKDQLPVRKVKGSIQGVRKKSNPADFISVNLSFEIEGVGQKDAEALVEKFKGR